MLVHVLDALPQSITEYNEAVVWAASLPANADPSIAFADGYRVQHGEWVNASPAPLHAGKYYFRTVLSNK